MTTVRGVVVAGVRSGCGKTSVSLGLMGALARRGLDVRPFKTGPDFIDPGHHSNACSLGGDARTSHNLDTWMVERQTVADVFARGARGGNVAVVEGVMGLFDGFSGSTQAGSTAELAKVLGLPVVLVVDASSMARSAAALVAGFAGFDPDLRLAGVIFNRVASESHGDLLTEAMASVPALSGVKVLGRLPVAEGVSMPSRHLGLVTADEYAGEPDAPYRALADWVEAHLDIDGLVAMLPEISLPEPVAVQARPASVRIGVARDEAFSFYYEENLRLLREHGGEIVEFSPLCDKRLPEGVGGLYLGGGYPELFLYELCQNSSLRKQVRQFSRAGRPIWAECGGFMYLLDAVIGPHGRKFSMCGVFQAQAVMRKKRTALGYREVCLAGDCPLGPEGATLRGHEFHYSALDAPPANASARFSLTSRRGPLPNPEGFVVDNTLGSYVHLHLGSRPESAARFVRACSLGTE